MNEVGSLIIGYDFSNGKNNSVLIVGKKLPNHEVDIINAFQGEEAEELFKKLTEVEKNNAEVSG